MSQEFNVLKPTSLIKNDRETINDNFEAIASDFSGDAFPTNNLFAHMTCFRTDKQALYRLNKDLLTWDLEVDYSNGIATSPLARGAETAEKAKLLLQRYVKSVAFNTTTKILTFQLVSDDGVTTTPLEVDTSRVNTINSIGPDSKGNVTLTTIELANKAKELTSTLSISKGGTGCTTLEQVLNVFGITDLVKNGIVSASTSGTNIILFQNDGDQIKVDVSGPVKSTSHTVTASTQAGRTASATSTGGYDTITTSGNANNDFESNSYEFRTVTGISAGSYTLQSLLQQLVAKSHTHTVHRTQRHYNCNCDCSDNDSDSDSDSCIIAGEVLTKRGEVAIRDLRVGDRVVDVFGEFREVKGIKVSTLGKREAVSFAGMPKAIFTDDHLYLIDNDEYGSYDVEGYIRESSRELTDGFVKGTYARKVAKEVLDLRNKDFVIAVESLGKYATRLHKRDLPDSTITYTPIVEDCEWILVNGTAVACARYIGG